MELEVAAFDLEDLARGAYAAFTALAQKKGLSFNLVIEPDARGGYLGDSTRLRQIIYNLVSNALKFTEVGQVQVGISRVEGLLSIRVSDTGMGIPARTLERLFDKFEQADATTTRRFGGSGLGLAICRELADLMGGAVRVESREGEGSTFTVELPLERIDATPGLFASPPVGPEATTEPMSRPIRLLAAEDNAVNQLVLKTLLHQAGVDPTIVPDGLQALEAWRNAPWDLILMDVQMPVMDGPTAARLIREEEAATGRARTPILALTANTMSHQIAEYLRDMDDVIPKPLEAARLYAAVDGALDRADAD
jgi:CheY-like chemotaxis protein/anti-sigma regulatory factor (Ser/Thr protein kinase)